MSTAALQDKQARGTVHESVSGWLLFLCLLLTLVYPVGMLYRVFHVLAGPLASHQPTHFLIKFVYCGLFAALALFSVAAGLRLWLIEPDAVRFARLFLLVNLAGHLAFFVFWWVVTSTAATIQIAQMLESHVIPQIASFALWYFYLEHSKRVRRTYGCN